MAKKMVKVEDEVIVVSEQPEEEVVLVSKDLQEKVSEVKETEPKEEKEEDEVTLVANTTEPVKPKTVKILMKEDHKCYIGGEWYYLAKEKSYNVPENVKTILLEAGKLKPL